MGRSALRTSALLILGLAVLAVAAPSAQAGDCVLNNGKTKPEGSFIYNKDFRVMQYCDGADWRTMLGGGIVDPELADLTDVDNTLTPDNGDVLTYNSSTSEWVSGSVSGTAGGVPSGALMAFDLASCPPGWSPHAAAAGRFIVGLGTLGSDTYTLGDTGGEARHALTVAELATHGHDVNPAPASFTTGGQSANHTHGVGSLAVGGMPLTVSIPGTQNATGNNATQLARGTGTLSGYNNIPVLSHSHSLSGNTSTESVGHTHDVTVDIPLTASSTQGSDTAHENRPPYLAARICRKD